MLDLKFGTSYHLVLETLETFKNLRVKLTVGRLKSAIAGYVLITSITLGMSTNHTFGTSHSEVF